MASCGQVWNSRGNRVLDVMRGGWSGHSYRTFCRTVPRAQHRRQLFCALAFLAVAGMRFGKCLSHRWHRCTGGSTARNSSLKSVSGNSICAMTICWNWRNFSRPPYWVWHGGWPDAERTPNVLIYICLPPRWNIYSHIIYFSAPPRGTELAWPPP